MTTPAAPETPIDAALRRNVARVAALVRSMQSDARVCGVLPGKTFYPSPDAILRAVVDLACLEAECDQRERAP